MREPGIMLDSRSASSSLAPGGRLRAQLALTLGIIVIAALTGPFGTIAMPLGTRFLLWGSLIGFNMVKWVIWNGWVVPRFADQPNHQLAMIALGVLLLNSTIGWEVEAVYAAVGRPIDLPALRIWMTAAAISVVIGVVIFFAQMREPVRAEGVTPPVILPLMQRASLTDLTNLHAVVAEDHYVRLHLADGRQKLELYRFGDALTELAAASGLQVHRGAWIADHAVASVGRVGRAWEIRLHDGTAIRVSNAHLPAVRARGWLARSA
jgi:LytTr DNA-binding domain